MSTIIPLKSARALKAELERIYAVNAELKQLVKEVKDITRNGPVR